MTLDDLERPERTVSIFTPLSDHTALNLQNVNRIRLLTNYVIYVLLFNAYKRFSSISVTFLRL